MQTFTLISLISNIILGVLVLGISYPRIKNTVKEWGESRKKQKENKKQLENARLVKLVRQEVIKYLEELKKG